MAWKLYLDDERSLPDSSWTLAKSSTEAIDLVKAKGMPSVMSLDHDLGEQDTSLVFLKWLAFDSKYSALACPQYTVHSANPVGRDNILAFLASWKKSCTSRRPVGM